MRDMQTDDLVDPRTKRSPVIRPQSERAPRYDAKLAVSRIRQNATESNENSCPRVRTHPRHSRLRGNDGGRCGNDSGAFLSAWIAPRSQRILGAARPLAVMPIDRTESLEQNR